MTKKELYESVANTFALYDLKAPPKEVTDIVLDRMFMALLEDGVVKLRGYGTFTVIKRKKRTSVHNPKTLEPVEPEDSWRIKFSPSYRIKSILDKDYLNRKESHV